MTLLIPALFALAIPSYAKPMPIHGQLSGADWALDHELIAVLWEVDLVRQDGLPIAYRAPVTAEGSFTFDLLSPPASHFYAPDSDAPRFKIATYMVAVFADHDEDGELGGSDLLIGVLTRPIARTRGPLTRSWLRAGAEPGWNVLLVDDDGDPSQPLMAVPLDESGIDIWLPEGGNGRDANTVLRSGEGF